MPPLLEYAVVPLLGPDGVGKTTLARAIAEAVSTAPRILQMDGRVATVIDIPTPLRVYQVVDFADDAAEDALLGMSHFHGAVLVVSASDSVIPGTRGSVERASRLGVPILATALTRCDVVADVEMLDLITMEIAELLTKYRFEGDSLPVVRTPASRTLREEPDGPSGVRALLAAVCK